MRRNQKKNKTIDKQSAHRQQNGDVDICKHFEHQHDKSKIMFKAVDLWSN